MFAFVMPKANAEPKLEVATVQQPIAKGDRATDKLKGTACAANSWPHYEHRCLFDRRKPANDAGAVRIIALR
jgi:hypothetical protein